MTAKAAMIPAAAMVLTALVGAGLGSSAARAQDACLAAPNAPAPAGSHWFYHTDQASQRKCWYLKPQAPAAQANPDRAADDKLARRVQAAMSAPDASAHPGSEANINPASWNDPRPPASAASFTWPDPPAPVIDNDAASAPAATKADAGRQAATAPSIPAAAAAKPPTDAASLTTNTGAATTTIKPVAGTAKQVLPAAPAKSDQDGSNAHPAPPAAASARQGKASRQDLPAAMKLAGIIVLLIAGMLMRRMLTKAFGRRQKIHIERREPVLIESVTAWQPIPAQLTYSPTLVPGPDDADDRIAEIEAALSKLAQRLRSPQAGPVKTTPSFFLNESARIRVLPRNVEIRPSS